MAAVVTWCLSWKTRKFLNSLELDSSGTNSYCAAVVMAQLKVQPSQI